uniref:Major facilitator superfamily (MFS) profile domain-containing protein n=1 Tax=Meloidogyne javanica TaxID=6303 RepID=A0A915N0S6_MELJA
MNNTSPSPLLSYKTGQQKQFSFPPHNFVIDIVTQQQTIQNSGKKRQHRKINELIPIRFLSQNSTEKINYGFVEPLFTSNEQSLLFSAIAIGQLIGTLPITKIYTRFGLRKLLAAYGFISSLSTLLIVPSIYLGGFATLLILQIFQGFGLAAIWVATGSISAHWSPLSNSGIFLAVLTSSFQLGPITAMPLSAEFCSSEMFGWPAVYYLLGTLSLFFFTIFYWIYRDSPREHEFLSAQELSIIEEGKSLKDISNGRRKRHGKELKQKILYMAILKDLAFWGVYLCSATSNLAFQVFWQFGPIYLNKALGMEVAKTGIASALPFLLSLIGKNFAGQISDRLTSVSEKAKVIFFASISQYLMGACFLAMSLFPKFGIVNVTLMQCIYTAATVFSGLNTVGLIKGAQLWADVFLLVTACIFVGTTFFNYVIEVEPREWTKTEIQSPKLSTTTVPGTTISAEEGKKLGLDVLQIS